MSTRWRPTPMPSPPYKCRPQRTRLRRSCTRGRDHVGDAKRPLAVASVDKGRARLGVPRTFEMVWARRLSLTLQSCFGTRRTRVIVQRRLAGVHRTRSRRGQIDAGVGSAYYLAPRPLRMSFGNATVRPYCKKPAALMLVGATPQPPG